MKDNKTIAIIVVVLLLVAGGFYFLVSRDTTEETASDVRENVARQLDTSSNGDDVAMEVPYMTAPTGAYQYLIDEGTASYIAQKRFLEKEDDVVEGITRIVSGKGWYNPEDGAVYMSAQADLAGLKSDSEKRDSDIQPFFTNKTAMIVMDDTIESIVIGQPFQSQVNTVVTINGVEQTVVFDVTGQVNEQTFEASGSALVNMSDFDINPPSLAGVFTVDDEIELTFDVVGARVMVEDNDLDSQDTMMETEDEEMIEEDAMELDPSSETEEMIAQ